MTKSEYESNIKKLNEYTRLYDLGTPAISDEEWDSLYFDCQIFEEETGYVDPKSPTSTVQSDVKNSLRKVTHNHPMLSLGKTKDINVLRSWLKYDSIAMAKMDGLTCSLTYKDGKLVAAETRGNGKIGEDVLHNAKTIKSIPQTIDCKDDFIIDGEVICTYHDFEEFSDLYKNPRNFASGSIRLMDANECKKRKLTFVAWNIISSEDNFDEKLKIMEKLGFVVVPYEHADIDHLEEQQVRICKKCSDLGYPIDGLVYKVIDYNIGLSLGKTEHHFNNAFAFKLYDQEYETTLRDIVWSVGKSGLVTPVAIFEPVEIDGVTVQRASMHNLTIMKEILGKPYVGQRISVFRANMVIPQIKCALD